MPIKALDQMLPPEIVVQLAADAKEQSFISPEAYVLHLLEEARPGTLEVLLSLGVLGKRATDGSPDGATTHPEEGT